MININSDNLIIASEESYNASPTEILNFISGDFEYWLPEDGKYIVIKRDGECRVIYYDFIYKKVNYIHWTVDFEYIDQDDYSDRSRLLWELFNGHTSIDGNTILSNCIDITNKNNILYSLLKYMTSRVYCNEYEYSGTNYGICYPEKGVEIVFEMEADKSCLVINKGIDVLLKNETRYIRPYVHTYNNLDRYLEISKSMNDHPSSMIKVISRKEISFEEVLSKFDNIKL